MKAFSGHSTCAFIKTMSIAVVKRLHGIQSYFPYISNSEMLLVFEEIVSFRLCTAELHSDVATISGIVVNRCVILPCICCNLHQKMALSTKIGLRPNEILFVGGTIFYPITNVIVIDTYLFFAPI